MKILPIGHRFGCWEVIGPRLRRGNVTRYLCRCDCGTEREVSRLALLRGGTLSCGCLFRRTPLERFMAKVEKDADTGCWLWTGGSSRGYGHFWRGEKKDGGRDSGAAHQWAYEHFKGAVPDGLQIDHLCRNPSCVNPDHLEAVTASENSQRAVPYWPCRKRTHCQRGHELTPENCVWHKNGSRQCRICSRVNHLRYYHQHKKRQR